MDNKDMIIKELWNNKVNVLFHIIGSGEVKEVLNNGFTRTSCFPFTIVQSKFNDLFSYVNSGTSVALVAIPDDLYMNVYGLEKERFDKWKSQFDYVYDEDGILSSGDVGNFCMWQSIGDYIENFIPSFLVFCVLTLNDKGEVIYIKNNNYYDSLSKSQKLKLCKLLRKAYYEYSMEYSEYEKFVRRIR